jgi:hypothetical protein
VTTVQHHKPDALCINTARTQQASTPVQVVLWLLSSATPVIPSKLLMSSSRSQPPKISTVGLRNGAGLLAFLVLLVKSWSLALGLRGPAPSVGAVCAMCSWQRGNRNTEMKSWRNLVFLFSCGCQTTSFRTFFPWSRIISSV